MGLITLGAIMKTGFLLLPSRPRIVLTAVALTGFHPAFLFMSSVIHHDALMSMIFALSFWWMVRAIYHPPGYLSLLAAGLLLGAGLITKLAGLSLAPLFGLTLLLIAGRRPAWKLFVKQCAVVFGVAFLVAGWWYIRNQLLYGDPLAWDMFLTVFAHMERQTAYSWGIFRHEFLGQLSRTFWGAFGYMHITLPVEIRRLFWWGSGFALLGTAWAIWQHGRQASRETKLAWVVLSTAVIIVLLSFFRLSLNMLGAGQGRYLMTIMTPISLLLAIGLHQWTGFRWPRLTALTVGLAYFAFSTWLLFAFVRPLYPLPVVAAAAQVTEAQPVNIQFGDALALVGYQLNSAGIAPGESDQLTLFWRPLGETRPDLYLKLRVYDAVGDPLYSLDTWPQESSSTMIWEHDKIYVSRHWLTVPPTAVIGPGAIELTIQPGREGEALAASPSSLLPLFIGQKRQTTADQIHIPRPKPATLGEHIHLLGYDLQIETAVSPTLHLTLYWQTDEIPGEDYTVFVHILDESGHLVAQQDNQPNNGLYPTTSWDVSLIIEDPYTLPLPAGDQTYTIRTGMYSWPGLERLPVTHDGLLLNGAITLAKVAIGN